MLGQRSTEKGDIPLCGPWEPTDCSVPVLVKESRLTLVVWMPALYVDKACHLGVTLDAATKQEDEG